MRFDTLQAIVNDDPPDLLPRGTALKAIGTRLLVKAPDARFQPLAEVSVRAMSGLPRRLVVSNSGGSQPVWRRDGHELLYVDRDGRLRGRFVGRQPTGELTLGAAVSLGVPLIGSGHWGTQYDVSPDGQHVCFIDHPPLPRPSEIDVAMGSSGLPLDGRA